jgi:hypothetical protein
MLPFIAFWSTPPERSFPYPDPLSAIHSKFKNNFTQENVGFQL